MRWHEQNIPSVYSCQKYNKSKGFPQIDGHFFLLFKIAEKTVSD